MEWNEIKRLIGEYKNERINKFLERIKKGDLVEIEDKGGEEIKRVVYVGFDEEVGSVGFVGKGL